MITEDYVSFEIAKLLKEKGFDWPCLNRYVMGVFIENKHLEVQGYYINGKTEEEVVSAPTLQMATKWLREVHKIFISIVFCTYPTEKRVTWTPEITTFDSVFPESAIEYDSYEEATEGAIMYCLKNLI